MSISFLIIAALPCISAPGAMDTPPVLTTSYDPALSLPRPEVETAWLYTPETEWTYSHHAHITWFKDHFYAIWSNGRVDEDAPGQRVLISGSTDGRQWTTPRPLVDSLPIANQPGAELILTAAGFHQYEGALVAYFGQYEDGFKNTRLMALTTLDGITWTTPRDMGVPVNPNHGPVRLASGRLMICGNISFPYTDDPAGLSGWTMAGIYPSEMAGMSDDPGSFWRVEAANGAALCEGSVFQTDDGVLRMPLRCCKPAEGLLWESESHDNGVTWSKPAKTRFTDCSAKFHFGRLPDDRFYYVGNPNPKGDRTPLVLSLSRDGRLYDQHVMLGDDAYAMKRPGRWKGGQFGYPHSLVHEGRLYVIVSRGKEAVEVINVNLVDIPG